MIGAELTKDRSALTTSALRTDLSIELDTGAALPVLPLKGSWSAGRANAPPTFGSMAPKWEHAPPTFLVVNG